MKIDGDWGQLTIATLDEPRVKFQFLEKDNYFLVCLNDQEVNF